MKKALLYFFVFILLASCGVQTPSWDEVYKMVDSGDFKSNIDEAIKKIGPEKHPASIEVKKYFNYFINGDLESAWALVERNSPYMTARQNLDEYKKSYNESKKTIDYKYVQITSLQIKKEMSGVRIVKVGFTLSTFDKIKNQDINMEGIYTMSNLTGQWLIFSSDL